jgi:hypothetical protein
MDFGDELSKILRGLTLKTKIHVRCEDNAAYAEL